MKVRDYASRYRFGDVNRLTCQMKCRLALLQLRQKFTGEAMNLARVVNPGVDWGTGPPPKKKSGAKRFFLEITIIFLERKKSLVSGVEPNYSFLYYCNKPQRHGVECKLTFAGGRYFYKQSGFYHFNKIKIFAFDKNLFTYNSIICLFSTFI